MGRGGRDLTVERGLGVLGGFARDGGPRRGGRGAARPEICRGRRGFDGGTIVLGVRILGDPEGGLVATVAADVVLDLLLLAAAAEEGLGVGVVPPGEAELGGGRRAA